MKRVLSLVLMFAIIISLVPTISLASGQFSDVSNHWARADIEELAAKGIINGMGDGTFQPEGQVTRAQFMKLVVAIFAKPTKTVDGILKDVPASVWSNAYVVEGLTRCIFSLTEIDNNYFKPESPMDRDEVALWITRAVGLSCDGDVSFADNTSIKNKNAVATAVSEGLLKGYENNTYRPKNALTRAESAVIIKRLIAKNKEIHTLRPSKNIVELQDGIKELVANNQINKLTVENDEQGYYVFENISDDIKQLKIGDLFVIRPCASIPTGIAIKVKEIKITGNKAEIWQDNLKLEDVVKEIDVSQKIGITLADVDENSIGEGVVLTNVKKQTVAQAKQELRENKGMFLASNKMLLAANANAKADEEIKAEIELKIDDNQKIAVQASLKNALIADVNFNWFKLEKAEIKVESSATIATTYTASIEGEYALNKKKDVKNRLVDIAEKSKFNKDVGKKWKLFSATVPIGSTPMTAEVVFYISVNLKGEFEVKAEVESKATLGAVYKNKSWTKISQLTNTSTISAEASGEIEAGPILAVRLGVLRLPILQLDAGLGLGARAAATIVKIEEIEKLDENGYSKDMTVGIGANNISLTRGIEEIHACIICFDGDGYVFAKAEVGLSDELKKLISANVSVELKKEFKILDFYLSFRPVMEFGIGECPHIYKKPEIITQPNGISAKNGEIATLTINAKNQSKQLQNKDLGKDVGLTYQWFKDGAVLTGRTGKSLILNPLTDSDSGIYTCEVYITDIPALKTVSNPAKVTVEEKEEDVLPPIDGNIFDGKPVEKPQDTKPVDTTLPPITIPDFN